MYSVTKKIEFCYGHRLLDYDGICKHPHGHNAVAEIEVRSGSLDNRNMVCDFSDIKRIVKGWVDRELDHKMILRQDDPLVEPLKRLGEPVFVVQSNPTVEHIAKLLYDYTHSQGFPVVRVRVWEAPTSFATFGGEETGRMAHSANSQCPLPAWPYSTSTARSSTHAATLPTARMKCSPVTEPVRSTKDASSAWLEAALRRLLKE